MKDVVNLSGYMNEFGHIMMIEFKFLELGPLRIIQLAIGDIVHVNARLILDEIRNLLCALVERTPEKATQNVETALREGRSDGGYGGGNQWYGHDGASSSKVIAKGGR